MCIKEISSFLPLHSQQLSDIFLIVRVAEGLCIKEHLIRAVTQQVFVNMSKLAGHGQPLSLVKIFWAKTTNLFLFNVEFCVASSRTSLDLQI